MRTGFGTGCPKCRSPDAGSCLRGRPRRRTRRQGDTSVSLSDLPYQCRHPTSGGDLPSSLAILATGRAFSIFFRRWANLVAGLRAVCRPFPAIAIPSSQIGSQSRAIHVLRTAPEFRFNRLNFLQQRKLYCRHTEEAHREKGIESLASAIAEELHQTKEHAKAKRTQFVILGFDDDLRSSDFLCVVTLIVPSGSLHVPPVRQTLPHPFRRRLGFESFGATRPSPLTGLIPVCGPGWPGPQ